ncbi:hypothetical protein Scep_011759 [Stephania cephalantha]|uniref:Transcription repressor n=1 Tax=Stephania cephalantha TaxID=152367 RepID=A0AAP0JDQ9_9MAGN
MHWRRKKSSSSSQASPPLSNSLSHVFPISWLSKFKHIGTKSKSQSAKTNLKSNSTSSLAPFSPLIFKDTQFYDGDVEPDDAAAYWRLSFGKDGNGHVNGSGRGNVKSFWDDSDDDDFEVPLPGRRGGKQHGGIVSDAKKRDLEGKDQRLRSGNARSHGRIDAKEGYWSCEHGRESAKAGGRSSGGETVEKSILDLEPIVMIRTPEKEFHSFAPLNLRRHNYISSFDAEDQEGRRKRRASKGNDEFFGFASMCPDHRLDDKIHQVGIEVDSEGEAFKVAKIKEFEKQRKSLNQNKELHRRRSKQSGKVKVYSPRTPPSKTEICKIRALEELKKAKAKKKARKADKKPNLESFAVAKSSFDPQKDFRDSMMEMITENNITQPEELENLLVCYLSLNSDQYHDLIIKVFQEVWIAISQLCSSPDLQTNEHSCSDY